MDKLLDQETITQLKEIFNEMKKPITLVYFTKEDCENCDITSQLLSELSEITDKITLNIYNVDKDLDEKNKYNIVDAPSYLMLDENNTQKGSVFYGVPAGHEFNTLITNILDVSETQELYDDVTTKTIESIDKPIDIKVFVTVSCPHCPGAAINASRLAQLNPNIKASIYEAQTFGEIADKYNVSGVPKIVINETEELMGNQPIEAFLETINKL